MTPQEKAKELVDKFQKQIFFDVTNERLDIEEAKGCALIAVDEIVEILLESREDYKKTSQMVCAFKDGKSFNENLIHTRRELDDYAIQKIMYWGMVKHEIEKL